MENTPPLPLIPLIAVAVTVIVFIWAIITMNRLTQLRNMLRESWSDIDIQLKRRHDLIPNLVETVRGYAAHESGVLENVMQARAAAMVATKNPIAQLAVEGSVVNALNGMFAVVEGYPRLKASAQFIALQMELANTEDRIAAARRFYNANVRDYNTLCSSFPSSLIASMRGLSPISFLELDTVNAREAPKVDLSAMPGSS
jgi:LemA protein